MLEDVITVAETAEFLGDVKELLTEEQHDALVLYVAHNPRSGEVIPETGGLRKLRWAAKGRGKRGGSRVIYYFHSNSHPLLLMAIYSKSAKSDLTPADRKALAAEVSGLKRQWKQRKAT